MNIMTLETIHQLLKQEAERTKTVANNARRLLHRFEADGADTLLIEDQRAAATMYDKEASRVADALKDFETTDWN